MFFRTDEAQSGESEGGDVVHLDAEIGDEVLDDLAVQEVRGEHVRQQQEQLQAPLASLLSF